MFKIHSLYDFYGLIFSGIRNADNFDSGQLLQNSLSNSNAVGIRENPKDLFERAERLWLDSPKHCPISQEGINLLSQSADLGYVPALALLVGCPPKIGPGVC